MAILCVLMIIAVGIGVYLTKYHETREFGGAELQVELVGCGEGSGCDAVANSDWAKLGGIPLFTWAVPFYGIIGVLCALVAIRDQKEWLRPVLLAGIGATLFSAFLAMISWTEVVTSTRMG